ncbi:MAG: 23S rRNA (uracil(1939)-C(5))-methyltransferase RlmD [Verrucomicrobia bacterium]|nr:23S rRNA (uracil(1939)-C(5))-methyltransferase RlmD [Verrucomicrobiota bacterium]MBS0637221.1 23S rRNA (uracil(1939)-C(5))-methyltransferase RlmD [Verrucomicrobiota bacterium]
MTTLTITELTPEGWGKASWERPDGVIRPVTVPGSLPGETVVCDLFHTRSKKAKGLLGKIVEVVTPSPFRIVPRCKHFSVCGGCTWQQMPYENQLEEKYSTLKQLFDYIDDSLIHPIIPAPEAWAYRNKMEFTFSEDSKGQKFLGLIMRASRGRVFTLEECHLVQPWISETLQAIYKWWQEGHLQAFYAPKNSGQLRYLTMRESQTTHDRVIILTVSGNPDYPMKQADLNSFVEVCKAHAGDVTVILRIQQTHRGSQTQFFEMRLLGPDMFRERVKVGSKELEFHLSPSSFFQPNSKQASTIYERALALANLQPDMVLYDLYAGIGIFGMCAAQFVKEVIAIELSADSAYDAKVNSDMLKLTNFRMIKGDVATVLDDPSLPKADVAIVDPPRNGLGDQAIKNILKLQPHTIVYVSCNPKTQREDVLKLIAAGYKVTAMQPIDQFAQTIHVENIIALSL